MQVYAINEWLVKKKRIGRVSLRSGGGGSKTSVPSSSSSIVTARPFFMHERRFLVGVVGGDGSSEGLKNVTCVVGELCGLYPN